METIYTLRKNAYLPAAIFIVITIVLEMIIIGISTGFVPIHTLHPIPLELNTLLTILASIFPCLMIFFSLAALSHVRKSYIKITPTQLEMKLSPKTTTVLWEEVQAYENKNDRNGYIILVLSNQKVLIPLYKFSNPKDIEAAIEAHRPAVVLRPKAKAGTFPPYTETIYSVSKKAYRTQVIWLLAALAMLITPFCAIKIFSGGMVVCLNLFFVFMGVITLIRSLNSFQHLPKSYIKITSTELEIMFWAKTIIPWDEVWACADHEDITGCIVLALPKQKVTIAIYDYLNPTELKKAIYAHLPAAALTREAQDEAFPFDKRYREESSFTPPVSNAWLPQVIYKLRIYWLFFTSEIVPLAKPTWSSYSLTHAVNGKPSQLIQSVNLLNEARGAKIAIVWLGTHELWHLYHPNGNKSSAAKEVSDLENISNNMDIIFSRLRATGAKIYLVLGDNPHPSVISNNTQGRDLTPSMSVDVARYNKAIQAKAKQYEVMVVDFYSNDVFTHVTPLIGTHADSGHEQVTTVWFNALQSTSRKM